MKIITEQELHEDIIKKLTNSKSGITFNIEDLETDNKTIKGALNEIFDKDERIKQILISICKTKGIEIDRKLDLDSVISKILDNLL